MAKAKQIKLNPFMFKLNYLPNYSISRSLGVVELNDSEFSFEGTIYSASGIDSIKKFHLIIQFCQ